MITQSFLYNAIFFTYALVLTKIYGVTSTDTAYYFMFFAARQPPRPADHRPPVRHHRPAQDDRRDLPPLRHAAGHQRRAVQGRAAQRRDPDGCAGA